MYRSGFKILPGREGATHEDLLRMLVQGLEKARARSVIIEESTVSFKGGMFRFVTGGNLLVAITSGRIEFKPEASRITYSLCFKQLVVVGTVMVGVFAALMAARGFSYGFFRFGLPVMWLWLVGMNYLIALARFDGFMKRGIRAAGFVIDRS